jgi:ATP-binding cassette subfamily B protein
VFEILDARPDIRESENPVRLKNIKGKITLENVTFAYEPNRPVLHGINITADPGKMIGLVGHTGAGKSTITNLITRLYDTLEGTVKIDGHDVRSLASEDLRRGIGIVLQETYLFSGTIAENVAYSRPDASREQIIAAAKAAQAHDFITELPDGYDTMLGRKGHDLSGGERQRISIARAILRDPKILIFDEATSSVDTETEEKIQKAIQNLIKGRTTIAIAHRLSTLRHADTLYIVEKGKIIEEGTHEKLMDQEGKYYELVQRERKALKVIGVAQ